MARASSVFWLGKKISVKPSVGLPKSDLKRAWWWCELMPSHFGVEKLLKDRLRYDFPSRKMRYK